ncbi:LamG-like jellyroll fold domain-containing protein [Tichowtungia aerotolerans]|uniref:VCBS repeat-containing protein n=1 Tax=Tichowtungia aerotolerans TaxID=2697043 RepID=A0A6P1M925_9BACT|nr:LamG-like jellyroll fold domain-containing protein [Tichowtungia aerotolerans]QHI69044.1 VCBS repeat-containing protein [Tichowtungia aerotolerans]
MKHKQRSLLIAGTLLGLLAPTHASEYKELITGNNPIYYLTFDSQADSSAEFIDVNCVIPKENLQTNGNPPNKSASFNGLGAHIDLGSDLHTKLKGCHALSMEFWIYNAGLQHQKVLSLYSEDTVLLDFYLNYLQLYAAVRSQKKEAWSCATVPFHKANTWQHVVIIADFQNRSTRIYVDGTLRKDQEMTKWKNLQFDPGQATYHAAIGKMAKPTGKNPYLLGMLDEVAIYDHAIDTNPENILKRYQTGKPLNSKPLPPAPQERIIKYNNPELETAAGVGLGAWPLPMDFDLDGDNDLLVAVYDKPNNGLYLLENNGKPALTPPVRIGNNAKNVKIHNENGQSIVTTPGCVYPDFRNSLFKKPKKIDYTPDFPWQHFQQWTLIDLDNDGTEDLLISAMVDDMRREEGYRSNGTWAGGEQHGYIYFIKNFGTTEKPEYRNMGQLLSDGTPIDVYGWPTACYQDWDHDGDYDIICGEFLDKLHYFENISEGDEIKFAESRLLKYDGKAITIFGQMVWTTAIDWDQDDDIDLVVGEEDGTVSLLENTGTSLRGTPSFLPPQPIRQYAANLKAGVLATPNSVDWDADGDDDIICGDSNGRILFIENLSGGANPKWNVPQPLAANDIPIRIEAGYNGSIQGPCEAKWGYTVPLVTDWDMDGLPDILLNDIWGSVTWYKNIGTKTTPKLAAPKAVEVEWQGAPPKPAWNWWSPKGKEFVTQWRSSLQIADFSGDGLTDLIALDTEGYLSMYERKVIDNKVSLLPPKRIFYIQGISKFHWNGDPKPDETTDINAVAPLQINARDIGGSGRRKFVIVDWDLDGKLDLLTNSRTINFLKNVSQSKDKVVFKDMGCIISKQYTGHTTCPTVVYWQNDGVPDLLFGAEDGHFYFASNPYRNNTQR